MNLKVILIEDKLSDATRIQERLQDTVQWLKEKGLFTEMKFDSISVVHVKGSVRNAIKREKYFHYEEEDIFRIEAMLQTVEADEKIAFLADILLSKQEVKEASINRFENICIVRNIYEKFGKRYPMYFITSILTFGSIAWSIFGEEHFCKYYIQKDLFEEKSRKAIARVMYWLANSEEMSEELARRIEVAEIQDWKRQ